MLIKDVYIKKLRVPLYRTSLWIVISDNVLKSIDTVEDLIDYKIVNDDQRKSVDAYTYGYQDHEGKMRIIIFVRPNTSNGRIAHECNHAVNIVLGWNGVKPSFTNDEAESYYLEFLVDKTHYAINHYYKLCATV